MPALLKHIGIYCLAGCALLQIVTLWPGLKYSSTHDSASLAHLEGLGMQSLVTEGGHAHNNMLTRLNEAVQTLLVISQDLMQLRDYTNISAASNGSSSLAAESASGCARPSFAKAMKAVPWDEIEKAAQSGRMSQAQIANYTQILSDSLMPFILMDPIVPMNATCVPPPLPMRDTIECSKYPEAFSGRRRDKPAKVAHMIQLGFDADVLEIHLHELDDVVDYFVIVESTRAHLQGLLKPLIWEHLSLTPRFAKFKRKVVHLVVDDRNVNPFSKDRWDLEHRMEATRWEAFLDWNSKMQVFEDDDVVGFGDADEIASREGIHLLKHCEMGKAARSVDMGIWFPLGVLDTAFISDWAVPGHRFTLGDPTFWTIASAKARSEPPNRMRGTSGQYLLGGIHMTDNRYLPMLMVKTISCTECEKGFEMKAQSYAAYLKEPTPDSIMEMELTLSRHEGLEKRVKAVADVEKELEGILYVPWYLNCNKARFPVWWRAGHDTRLDL